MAEIVPTHRWNLPGPLPPVIGQLAQELKLPEPVVRLLWQRGYCTAAQIQEFLEPSASRLNRPDTLPDIAEATHRVIAALKRQEPILVYGDYDVDGVTGTALLFSVLQRLGGTVYYYLPHREREGYGFSPSGVRFAQETGCRLIITNDCGSTDGATVRAAQAAGIDTIITDHHEPGPEWPPANAFVNPKRADSDYPFPELAGCGVAFKLAWSVLAALHRPKEELIALLDLVGLATIADVVPLKGENRVLARIGLGAISRTTRPGLQALIQAAGLNPKQLTGAGVLFGLAPRINAAGRVGHAQEALRLLLTEDPTEAQALARRLDRLNRSRQSLEDRTRRAAAQLIEEARLADQRVIVVAGENWHEGVIGVVAARLVEQFYRPCIVVTLKGEIGKGSGRSVTGFNLYQALQACRAHLTGFGGHRYAAGLRLVRSQLEPLRAAINQFAAALPEELFQPSLHIEAVAELAEIDQRLLAALARLEPFGPDNPEPIFATLGLEVVGFPRRIGREQNHLKFRVRSGNRVLAAVAWGRSSDIVNLEIGRKNHLDICYTITPDRYAGRNGPQLNVLDLRTTQRVP